MSTKPKPDPKPTGQSAQIAEVDEAPDKPEATEPVDVRGWLGNAKDGVRPPFGG